MTGLPNGVITIILVVTVVGTARAESGVVGFALPTRRSDAQALAGRAQRVAKNLAKILALPDLPDARSRGQLIYLGPLLERARSLSLAGSLDEAANTFDSALAMGVKAPDRLAEPAQFVSAHVDRASIAFARQEGSLEAELLERLLRYDPSFALRPAESSPQMRATLDEVRRRIGAHPSLNPSDLGEVCQGNNVVVARFLEGNALELSRFSDCKFIAQTSAGDDVAAARALAGVASASMQKRPVYKRPWLWVTVGLVAAATVALGAGLGVGTSEGAHLVAHYPP
jgi:hypothetical protein